MSKRRLEEVEAAMAAHPKGRPMVGNQLMPDPIPVAPPLGYKKQPSILEMIRAQVAQHVAIASAAAANSGLESFEEADDFDVDDDPEIKSPYELADAPLGGFPPPPVAPAAAPASEPPAASSSPSGGQSEGGQTPPNPASAPGGG